MIILMAEDDKKNICVWLGAKFASTWQSLVAHSSWIGFRAYGAKSLETLEIYFISRTSIDGD